MLDLALFLWPLALKLRTAASKLLEYTHMRDAAARPCEQTHMSEVDHINLSTWKYNERI